jgi:hypothetical protein
VKSKGTAGGIKKRNYHTLKVSEKTSIAVKNIGQDQTKTKDN